MILRKRRVLFNNGEFMNRLRVVYICFITFSIALIGCFDLPEELIMPEWDVDLNVPLTNKTYTLYDMFKPESQRFISTSINNENFYLIQTDFMESYYEILKYISIANGGTFTKDFIVPANASTNPVFITFPDSVEIERGTFMDGQISFSIQNPHSAAIFSRIKIAGVRKPDGSELIIESNLQPFESDSISYDLTGCEYVFPQTLSSQNKNGLHLEASANCSLPNAFEVVHFYGYGFRFSSVTGVLPQKSLGIKSTSSFLEINDAAALRDKIFIKECKLTIKSQYSSLHQNNFSIEVKDAKFIGKRKDGQEKLLRRSDGQSINLIVQNGLAEYVFDQDNSNISDFLAFLPDTISISAECILNPLNERLSKTVTNQDSINFLASFSAKSVFAIKQTNFKDTVEIEISQDDRDKIRKSREAELNIHIENAIPIDAHLKASVLDKNYNTLFVLTQASSGPDSLFFAGSQVNNSTGQIISPTFTANSIMLKSSQINQLADARYIILSTTINTTNGFSTNPPMVYFKSSDWLKMKCFGKIRYRVASGEK